MSLSDWEAFGFSGLGLVVGPCLFHGLGLGALGEVGVGEALGEGVAFLLGGHCTLGQTVAFGVEVDHAFERQGEGCFVHNDLCSARARED